MDASGWARADAILRRGPALVKGRRMRPRLSPVRRLTPGEQALGREMFGAGLDLGRTLILGLPLWRRAFVAGPRLIVWPAAALPADFAAAPLHLQAAFVHELAHVWQAARGIFLPLAKIRAGDGARAYAYEIAAALDFAALNIEQQAMVVEHAFLASRGAPVPYARELYDRLSAAWRGG